MIPRLELRGITKRFPGVIANASCDLSVAPGETHALLGENGAGKSTLVKIICGVLQADEGDMLWDGKPIRITDPKAARALGIGMVFQHFLLFEAMTVLENITLGLDRPEASAVLAKRIRAVSAEYGLPVDPGRAVHTLSVGERQRVEIVRCLLQSPRLLIMDEPTSVLTPQEADRLFDTLRTLANAGCSILYISHKLAEIKALCDRATVLRGGRVVATCDPRGETTGSLAQMMIGGQLRPLSSQAAAQPGPVRLRVAGLDLPADLPHGTALSGVALEVRGGEILGIAGVAGNGQGELFRALDGERLASRPEAVEIDDRPAGRLDAGARRALGLCAVPEERNGHAAVPVFSLAENAVLTGHSRLELARAGLVLRRKAREFASQVIREFDVRTPGADAPARSLSGGNLQKFVVGREIMQRPGVLVVAQPTWGVDAGAAASIHQALLALAAEGSAVLVISQDLDELFALSHRLAVLNEGRLSEAFPTAAMSVERLGLLMGGVHGPAETPEARPTQEMAYALPG